DPGSLELDADLAGAGFWCFDVADAKDVAGRSILLVVGRPHRLPPALCVIVSSDRRRGNGVSTVRRLAMPTVKFNTALIVGPASGLSAALDRVLSTEGIKVALAARSTGDLEGLAKEIGATTHSCDASKRADVEKLFADLDGSFGAPEIVIYNPSYRTRAPFVELDPAEVEKTLMVTAFGGFLVGQQAVKRMLPKKNGCAGCTGAWTSVKVFAQSAPCAMGRLAVRGLRQSMSRELHPQGAHVAHIVIDGGI